MVSLKSHGGQCCGAQHIHGFVTGRVTDILELYRLTQQRDPCLHEVILNEAQCRANPLLVAKLAELGYVLTTGFVNGNHKSSVYVFHRAGQRLPLNDLRFDWAGQIASPSLAGILPRLPEMTGNNGEAAPMITAVRGAFVFIQHIRPGDVFTYYNPQNALHGALLMYVGPGVPSQYSNTIRLTNRVTGLVVERAVSTLRWYSQANPPTLPVIPLQRHAQNDEFVVNVPAPVEPAQVVLRTYHNVFRDGRVGAGYPSEAEARKAAPRALYVRQRRILSSGNILEDNLP